VAPSGESWPLAKQQAYVSTSQMKMPKEYDFN